MNRRMIAYVLGILLLCEAGLLLFPTAVALIFSENVVTSFLFSIAILVICGFILVKCKPKDTTIYARDGLIIVSLGWIVLSLFGALPFFLSGEIPHYIDAVFETVSGFTTTGSSILSNVEALSKSMLFWRSFTHWIGGMGVLVFLLAIVPLSGGSNMNLMRAESPGPSVGKLVPKMRYTARILYVIYFALTILELIALLIAKMPWFDALCISVGTAGTGGFGILNSSIGGYSIAVQWIVTIFMILFGINFNAYYLILFGQIKNAFKMEEVRVFLSVVLLAIVIITFDISNMYGSLFEAVTDSAFQVASVVSSTGFATTDFDLWPGLSKTILVLLMFMGACAGSTGGGIKVSRFVLVAKSIKKELHSYIHPKAVKQIVMDDKEVEYGTVRSVFIYFLTFATLFVVSILIIALEEKDLVTNFTSVLATMNNIGPGLSMVGPTQNFAHFSILSKWVFMFDMLAGRLELFPLLILFHPSIWHDLIVRPTRKKFRKTHL